MGNNHGKWTCALFAVLLLVSGCGGTEEAAEESQVPEQTEQTEASVEEAVPQETEPAYDPLPEVSMDGFAFRFLNYEDAKLSWAINLLTAEEVTGDSLNDEVWARNDRIMTQYDCVIEETKGDPTTALTPLILSGDAGAEVVMLYDEQIVPHYVKGDLQTWENLPYVDFENPYWSWEATQTFNSAGRIYAATGDFSLAQNTRSFVLLYNKDMYTDLGMAENLYDLTGMGKWTMDKMLEIAGTAVADLDGNGEMNMEDRYGNAGAIKLYFGSLVTGAGIKYIDLDEEGKPYFAIPGNEYALTVMSDILNKHSGTYLYQQVVTDIHGGTTESRQMFMNNQLLFVGTAMKAIEQFRDMESDIGILPFPKYSEEQDRYYALTSGGSMATLPITLRPESYANVGILLEALCRDSEKGLIPLYKETLLKSRYARDEGSAAMLDIIFASAVYDIGLSTIPNDTYYRYMEVFKSGSDTFASTTQSIQKLVEKKLETLIKEE